jgi:mannan endo-1,4-beta-mannosidase
MRARFVIFLAIAFAVAALAGAAARVTLLFPSRPPVVHASLPTKLAGYLGVFEADAPPSYAPVASFVKAGLGQPNLLGYYSGWTEPFDQTFARLLHAHGIVPFVQLDPTDASVAGIAAGYYDAYLRKYADEVNDFGHAVVIGFGHEMNAPWYPWGYGHVRAPVFIKAWRHIVTLFRGEGADNVIWLWTINQDRAGVGGRPGTGPVRDWWPGPKYVTWVGIDGYYFRQSDTFRSVFGTTIDQVHDFTRKPVLLSETAVGPRAGQFTKILDLFAGMRRYGTLGLVWFDKNQDGGIYHQDWRLEGNPPAEAAFRLGVRDDLALARP